MYMYQIGIYTDTDTLFQSWTPGRIYICYISFWNQGYSWDSVVSVFIQETRFEDLKGKMQSNYHTYRIHVLFSPQFSQCPTGFTCTSKPSDCGYSRCPHKAVCIQNTTSGGEATFKPFLSIGIIALFVHFYYVVLRNVVSNQQEIYYW
jgi:hypothetical protein